MIKKKLFKMAAILFISSCSLLFAQENQFGVKGGVNLSKLSFKNSPSGMEVENRVAFIGGINYTHYFTNSISVRPELLFLQHTAKVKHKTDVQKNPLKLSYLSIPILVNYNFMPDNNISARIFCGPQFSLMLKGKETISTSVKSGNKIVKNNKDQDVKGQFKKFDFGLQAGIGVDIKIKKAVFFLEGAYMLGLTNINKSYHSGNIKSRGIAITLGGRFPL